MPFTFQATGDETEIYDENDDAAIPVVLVPFLDSETPEQHQARVRAIVAAMNASSLKTIETDASKVSDLRKLALRAIGANRIVAATGAYDVEDNGLIFEVIHEKANDLTIDTQRALARRLGWLVGSDGMAEDISPVGCDLFDPITHGIANDEDIARAFKDGTGEDLLPPTTAPEPFLLVQTDDQGYVTLHEPDEDGSPGDLIASVWRDDWLPSLKAARLPVGN